MLTAVLCASAQPAPGIGKTRYSISVANYQMAPTEPQGPMLQYFGRLFNADFTVLNFDNQHFHEQLNVRIASGTVPDFWYLRTATTLPVYARLGIIAPIDRNQLKEYAPHLSAVLQEYAPGYLDMGKIDGIQYGIPVVSPTNIFHVPLVYRADWMKRVGVTNVPRTLSEFEDLMYRFTRNDPDRNGKNDTYGLSRDGLTAVFGAFGLVPFDVTTEYWMPEDGRIINAATSKRAKEALAILARWYRDGVIDPQFITGENQGGYWAISHAFITGRIGFTTHGNYYHWIMPGAYRITDENGKSVPVEGYANGREFAALSPEAEILFGSALRGPHGQQCIKSYNRLMNFVCIGTPASYVPGKMERILRILDASASPDFRERTTLHYGLENVHWKMTNPATESFVTLPPYDSDESYWSKIGCELSIEVPLPSKSPRERWARSLGLDTGGIESLVQVGLPVMMQYDTALRQMRTDAYIAIITGEKPVSYFDEFVRQYLAAGGADVQKEVQAYYEGTKK